MVGMLLKIEEVGMLLMPKSLGQGDTVMLIIIEEAINSTACLCGLVALDRPVT